MCSILGSKGHSSRSRLNNICWNRHCTGGDIHYSMSGVDLEVLVCTEYKAGRKLVMIASYCARVELRCPVTYRPLSIIEHGLLYIVYRTPCIECDADMPGCEVCVIATGYNDSYWAVTVFCSSY